MSMEGDSPTDWAALIAAKRKANVDKIPEPWRLAERVLANISQTSTFGVLGVPKSCGILSAEELKLTEEYDATDLTAMLREGKVKSEEVVLAFCKRAAIAHQLVSSLLKLPFNFKAGQHG